MLNLFTVGQENPTATQVGWSVGNLNPQAVNTKIFERLVGWMKCLFCNEVKQIPAEYTPCVDCRKRMEGKVLLIAYSTTDKSYQATGRHPIKLSDSLMLYVSERHALITPNQFKRYTGKPATAGDVFLIEIDEMKKIINRLIEEI